MTAGGDGEDPELGSGGICDEVAEIMETSSARGADVELFDVARTAMITPGWWPAGRRGLRHRHPPGVYESGGGYNWRKKTVS